MSIASLLAILSLPLLTLAVEPELEHRRLEPSMLHHQLKLTGLRPWTPTNAAQPLPPVSQQPPAVPIGDKSVLVVHLWAVHCEPCVAEFPIWQSIVRSFAKDSHDRLGFVFITETLEESSLAEFWQKHRTELPEGSYYQSIDGMDSDIRRILRTTKQPVTLLLDRQGAIRQAYVGSIAKRRNELVGGIERLLILSK